MPCSGIIAAIGFVFVSRDSSMLAHGRNSRDTRNARNQSPAGQTLDAQNIPVCPCARKARAAGEVKLSGSLLVDDFDVTAARSANEFAKSRLGIRAHPRDCVQVRIP